MSEETRYCPECGSALQPGENFCSDCGTTLAPVSPEVAVPEAVAVPETVIPSFGEESLIGAEASVNIGGDIHKTSNTNTNVQTSNNINTTNTSNVNNSSTRNVNMSKVDNSSNVQNNTTIVMNGEQASFCEVCGDPLGEKHARCPKCGKKICFDCRIKGKNRCVECEKKAVNEYRVAFQQLLLTTNGNIGMAGRQMMDQKARDLDVEDVKAKIENECSSFFKPQKSAAAAAPAVAEPSGPGEKRLNVPTSLVTPQGGSVTKAGDKKKVPVWAIAAVAVVVVVAVVAVVLPGGKEKATPEVVQTTSVQEETKAAPVSTPAARQTPAQAAPAVQTAPVAKPAPAQAATDADYEAGMAAYNSGNGLDAVNAFTKSGSAESHYMLGLIYKNGCGSVGKNEMKAHKSFKKAASMGHEGAKAQL